MAIRRTSFSQSMTFQNDPRVWYMKYILKVPGIENLMYANGGQCLHRPIDKYYMENKPELKIIKKKFEELWNKEYDMPKTDIAHKKDDYWLQVIEAINLNLELSHSELKIEFDDIVAYIDGWDETTSHILDWKSSTRSKDNEEEYSFQLKFYSYLLYRSQKILPKKATVYYLKYKGKKQTLTFEPSMQDIREAHEWHIATLRKMDYYIKNPDQLPPFNRGYHWSPYKHFWNVSEEDTLRFTVIRTGGYIKLQGPLTKLLNKQLCRKFHYEPKSAFEAKKRNPYLDTTVRLWNDRNQTLPIGLQNDIYKTLFDYGKFIKKNVVIDVEDKRVFNNKKVEMPKKLLGNKELRPYQLAAINKFLRRENIASFEIATGGGKTLIAAECIRSLKMKTIFIVHTERLLLQTKKVFEDELGIEIGQVGDGVKDFKDVTVATIQTLIRNPMLYRNVLSQFRFVIWDEVHKAAANSYYEISNYLPNTEFRLGLTATYKRDDGNDLMLKGIAGEIIHKVESDELIKDKFLVKPTIIFIKDYIDKQKIKDIEFAINPNKKINQELDYREYYNAFISTNKIRNDIIKIITDKYKDKKILILTKLVDEHGKPLSDSIPGSKHIHGKTKKSERDKIFKEFVDGDFNILVSTLSIFAEGVDIPSLDMVINTSANKGDVKTIQVLGRVLRTTDGKNEAFYIDFFDNMPMFRSASLARSRALKKEGHNISYQTLNDFLGIETIKPKSINLTNFIESEDINPKGTIQPDPSESIIYNPE